MVGLGALVSIVIPVYNREDTIGECIDHLLSQDYKNIEILVSYDESPDSTFEILNSYGDKIIILEGKKSSPAAGRNRALQTARGQFIAFCDSDDTSMPTRVSKQVAHLTEGESILTYSDFDLKSNGVSKEVICPEWNKTKWLKKRFFAFSSVMIRMEVLQQMKKEWGYWFDESLTRAEDFDFLIRLSQLGEFSRTPGVLITYNLHKNNISRDIIKVILARNKILLDNGLMVEAMRNLVWDAPHDLVDYLNK
jgi:glycosyltransferase involved in cell wall biosynthesis